MPHSLIPLVILWVARSLIKAARFFVFGGRVIKVCDGDTIKIKRWFFKVYTVRIAEMDAPEKDQAGGQEATQALIQAIPIGTYVVVGSHTEDRYGRLVATIYDKHGVSVGERMIRSGHAWHYSAYSKSDFLASLHARAKKAKRGLWRKSATAPWKWRKR